MGFLSKEIQRQLGLKTYEPRWAMVHNIRKLIINSTFREKSGQICGHSVNSEAGATQHILDKIEF
jgi:3-deoxy-D-manno-octulosonic-acid transferase